MSIHDLSNLLICPEDLTSIDEKSDSYIFTKNLFTSLICLGRSKSNKNNSVDHVRMHDYGKCMNDNMNKKVLQMNIDKEIYLTFKNVPPTNIFLEIIKSDLEGYEIPQRFQMKKECYDIASKTKKDMYMLSDMIVEPIKPHDFCDTIF